MDKSNFLTVKIKDEDMPIMCTMKVLKAIYDKYGDPQVFADLVFKTKENEQGQQVHTGEAPDIDAIYSILPLMINEGITVYNDGRRSPMDLLDEDYIYRYYEEPLTLIGYKMLTELKNSLFAPKRQPPVKTSQK